MATFTILNSSSLSTLRRKSLFSSIPNPSSKTLIQLPQPTTNFPNFIHKTTISPLRSTTTTVTADAFSATTPLTLKSRLRNGETLYGLFLLSFSPTLAEIAALAGYDFVVVDMEHGHGGISDALPCLHALAAANTPAILRLPESDAAWAKKALDLGPQGIMFPMIESPKSARKAVSYCRFPPNGVRGSAHTVVRASNYGINAGYLTDYEEDLLIMCQIESEEGVKKIEEISQVEGVDCIQMGPLDLSASMGYFWDPGNKKVREMMRVAEKAVLKTQQGGGSSNGGSPGAYLAGFAMPHDSPDNLRSRGYQMVSGAVDIGLFRSAAVEDVRKFKNSLVAEETEDEMRENGKDGDEKYWSE